jgi:hypothetical protein
LTCPDQSEKLPTRWRERRPTIRSSIEKLVAKLASGSRRQREASLVALGEQPAQSVIGPVTELLLDDSSSTTQAACLDLLERLGASFNLQHVRTDGWFEQIGAQFENFDVICEVLGARFLALSMILGIELRSVTRDPLVPANATVEFCVDDDLEQTLTLGEFKVRMVQAILQHVHTPEPVTLPLDRQAAMNLIGRPQLLLAPLYGISLRQLVVGDPAADPPRAAIGYLSEAGFSFMALDEFSGFIKQKLHRELAGAHAEPFRLDLTAVESARAAAADEDHDRVIAILQSWPGLLATLQRTPVLHQLDAEQRALIAEGLTLLGDAFKLRGRRTWSEELYRLGLQFVREGVPAGRLFFRLGEMLAEEERHGEAIGLLRRAHSLGVEERLVFPLLGRAFLRRDKLVAAATLLELAARQGAEGDGLARDLEEIRGRFDAAGVSWKLPESTSVTIPPDGGDDQEN